MVRRSVLFSPGDRPDLMRKAPETGADTVVFDLEDAVVPDRKDEARTAVREILTDEAFDPDAEVCVRLTAAEPAADLDALLGDVDDPKRDRENHEEGLRLDALVVPKVDSKKTAMHRVELARARGFDVPVLALVETAAGVLAAEGIANVDGIEALIFGAEDLAADVGATRTKAGQEVLYARQHVVLAASAGGIDAIDTVYTDFEDEDGLREEVAFARQLGYDGKLAIHPAQVDVINGAYTPDESELAWARRVLEARERADRDGRGVFEVDGEMIDRPLILRAERIRERARGAGIGFGSDSKNAQ
ncbi:Beta-methylmalyl-CoA lyase, Citrate lyase beta subunit family [Halalkaliarchaeum sp. AArc-CO]|uniref:HpcH/HpaI aldolase/citrate lyase family protein n=1 Tax=unclassified Halalkaliarchaeum TaxID=2678344 RepID=UPI00217CF65C|nr:MULTISPECIES: CoA ester lyase [unclassified Halalkaliarchaeum]MDR5672889.1 CoA ester lyase [Halalkaliarchaeum sp. AArc-GB]UWG50237.1 Beta-methylmalyl-CoA lyase, Citrate lyase beta subunit family [Halalkaliarchaeum sp. AArc-CO]